MLLDLPISAFVELMVQGVTYGPVKWLLGISQAAS